MHKKYLKILWGYKYIFIILLLLIGLYNPNIFWFFSSYANVAKNVYFVVDVSKSMDVEDMQGHSRLSVVKNTIINTVSLNTYNNYALSIFADRYFNIVPLTDDIDTFINIVSSLDTNFVSKQGTNFYDVIKNIIQINDGTVIIFSDGEDLNKDYQHLLDDVKMPIYTVGVGTEEGMPIPLKTMVIGQKIYKKNSKGDIIISKLNAADLINIANKTNGEYIMLRTATPQDLGYVINKFVSKDQKDFIKRNNISFVIFTFIAFILILFFLYDEYFQVFFINKLNTNMLKSYIFILVLGACFILTSCDNIAYYYNKEGIDKYIAMDYTGSYIDFQNAYKEKKDPIIEYNQGSVEYKKNNFKESLKILHNIKFEDKKNERDRLYNIGNNLYKIGLQEKDPTKFWVGALNAYSGAIAIDKNDDDAYKNYLFVLNKLKQQEKQNNESKDKQSNSDNNKDGDENKQGQPQQGVNTGEFTLNEAQKQEIEKYIRLMKNKQIQNMQNFKRTEEHTNRGDLYFYNDPFLNPDLNRGDDEY